MISRFCSRTLIFISALFETDPNVSEEAKEHARDVLEDKGAI